MDIITLLRDRQEITLNKTNYLSPDLLSVVNTEDVCIGAIFYTILFDNLLRYSCILYIAQESLICRIYFLGLIISNKIYQNIKRSERYIYI